MNYESWRATFQSSEQAARAAFAALQAARAQSRQDEEPVGFVQGGGLEQLSKGHPAKIYPKNVTPSPLELHAFVYTQPQPAQHPDDEAVDRFARAMKVKLAKKRGEGRGGWGDERVCPPGTLQQMLIDHLEKGDPVDIGNFAMMIWSRGESVTGQPAQQGGVPEGWRLAPVEPTKAMRDAAQDAFDRVAMITYQGIYRAMLAAAPQPPQEGE